MKTIIQLFTIVALIFMLNACSSGGVIVGTRPEPPYYERPASPGPDYIWIDGEWDWVGGRYNYHPGYWSRPRPHRVWTPGGWEQRGDGWRWRHGRWH